LRVRFVVEQLEPSLVVPADTPLPVVSWRLRHFPRGFAAVVDAEGRWLGAVPGAAAMAVDASGAAATLEDVMRDGERVPVVELDDAVDAVRARADAFPDWDWIAVLQEGRFVGIVHRADLAADAAEAPPWTVAPEVLQSQLMSAMRSGLLIVDPHGYVRALNPRGAEILSASPDAVVGRPYAEVAEYIFPHMSVYRADSLIPRILAGMETSGDRSFTLANGRDVRFNANVVRSQGRVEAILVTFTDVTDLNRAERRARREAEEAEKAFALTLPNSRVEAKLKSSPEYQDVYDPTTGLARVTAVIPDGTYRHVINGLRVMAELKAIGLFQLVGLDKDTLVSAFTFHDLGKEQPRLALNQVFNPQETFEPGRRHAERSAEWAAKYYRVSEDAVQIVRHHHTPEDQLPPDFPHALLPMLRVMKLVDGLSAGLTRRLAWVGPFELDGTILTVREYNRDTRYHRAYRLALLTGREAVLHEDHPPAPTLGDLSKIHSTLP
jgi:PAS domain-containing protein